VGSQTVFPDYVSGVLCAIGIVSGVLYRERNRRGAFIDLAQSEAAAFLIGACLMEAEASGQNPKPIGNGSVSAAPHGCYPCKGEDRWCVIAADTEAQWSALAASLGGGVEQDARFNTVEGRVQHREELDRRIAEWTRDQDAFAVVARLQRYGVPSGVVQNGEDLTNDPHLVQRGFIVSVENARLGRVILPGFPLHFTNARLTRRWEFPVLGRDTEAVLRDVVGYSDGTIAAYKNERVLE
jgi:benzylsuccinate CoA-transferase BbsF subunit